MDDFLSQFPDVECSCKECAEACEYSPCWGTPEEIRFLIFVGYGKRMTLHDLDGTDFGLRTRKVKIVTPGFAGLLRRVTTSTFYTGICEFLVKEDLTKMGLCELHDKKLKPLEGRIVDHAISPEEGVMIRRAVFETWDTPEGRSVVDMWVKEYLRE